jgi:hypothetical protein
MRGAASATAVRASLLFYARRMETVRACVGTDAETLPYEEIRRLRKARGLRVNPSKLHYGEVISPIFGNSQDVTGADQNALRWSGIVRN